MAATAAGAALTEAHRLAQVRLAAVTSQQLMDLFGLLDPADLDGTVARWLRSVVPAVTRAGGASAQLSANYLRAFRAVELGQLDGFAPVVAGADPAKVAATMTAEGPWRMKKATARGMPLDDVAELGMSESTRGATRHVLDAGRSTLIDSLRRDDRAVGWARAASGNACAFCAMVASRGPVYKSEDSAGFESHNGCGCTAEPIYRSDAEWPAGSERYRELWDEATAGEADQLNAFRSALGRG